ncbi:MAG: DUF3862 domain-containing protein [Anaeroplasmataceae bacterium]
MNEKITGSMKKDFKTFNKELKKCPCCLNNVDEWILSPKSNGEKISIKCPICRAEMETKANFGYNSLIRVLNVGLNCVTQIEETVDYQLFQLFKFIQQPTVSQSVDSSSYKDDNNNQPNKKPQNYNTNTMDYTNLHNVGPIEYKPSKHYVEINTEHSYGTIWNKKTIISMFISFAVVVGIIGIFISLMFGFKSDINKKNYAMIEIGMTYAEVVEILGEPSEKPDFSLPSYNATWVSRVTTNGRTPLIAVVFVDGYVYRKTSENLSSEIIITHHLMGVFLF